MRDHIESCKSPAVNVAPIE